MVLNKEQIQEVIPHRFEMLLIDEVEIITPGVKATGKVILKDDTWFFKGHFPIEPVMPGVLQVEAAAQIGAVALLSLEENKGKIGYFGGIDKAKFKQKVVPGDILEITVEITAIKGPIGKGSAKGYVNNKLAFSAELTFAVM